MRDTSPCQKIMIAQASQKKKQSARGEKFPPGKANARNEKKKRGTKTEGGLSAPSRAGEASYSGSARRKLKKQIKGGKN